MYFCRVNDKGENSSFSGKNKQIVAPLVRQLSWSYFLAIMSIDEHIELLHLDNGNIRVAEYMTTLPEEKALQEKLMRAISKAKEKLKS